MEVNISPSWKKHLSSEFSKPYFLTLTERIRYEYKHNRCFPPGKEIFNAFELCPFDQVKVVILGQDPYHGEGQAEGLCFSVKEGIAFPPSLQNIFKEIQQDLGLPIPSSGSLRRWAKQGVLLLNTTLTVRAHQANSHSQLGWEKFTDEVINLLAQEKEHLVFFLWGSHAQRKARMVSTDKHLLLSCVHPSPLSAYRGFFGQHQFSRCNKYLLAHGKTPIQW